MSQRQRTQVAIVGAGPAGLLLSHLLGLAGIESVVVELRSREYVEQRQRAGLLEHGTVDLLRATGLATRLDAQSMEHGGIYIQFGGRRHHLDFRDLTEGRTVTVYAQTEVVKDLIAARLNAGHSIEFEVSETSVQDVTTDRPVLRYRDREGRPHEIVCDAIAGCDGFHGVSRPTIPDATLYQRDYPYAWLGIIADVAPSTDELIYAHHADGFALHSVRTPQVSRLYLQVDAAEQIEHWSDDRIWDALHRRFALDGWQLKQGPVREKAITPMRSFVCTPMRHGRLFLAGDSAHIVPPTGAKGLNLAIADVAILAQALVQWLKRGRPALADRYTDTCLNRVWRATYFSWWMTTMLHTDGGDDFAVQLQRAQLAHVTSSRAAATSLAENYVGLPLDVPALA
jgi:p-hydroxybenzoate 3-monooxygenase